MLKTFWDMLSAYLLNHPQNRKNTYISTILLPLHNIERLDLWASHAKFAYMTLDKFFNHHEREQALYADWEKSETFKPEHQSSDEVFSIAMPPPNANGELHLGHSLGYTVMDILGRFYRMNGKSTLLLPGKDHAGIQTQVVYEKKLRAERKEATISIPRDELYKMCYDFCIDRANYMRSQEKRLGLSADWSREFFTLDPRLNKIVFETFEEMHKDGLVYKGKRIVNWSVYSQTSISDVEVQYQEAKGNLWYLAYPLISTPKAVNRAAYTLPEGVLVKPWNDGRIVISKEKLTAGIGNSITIGEEIFITYALRQEKLKELSAFNDGHISSTESLSFGGDNTLVHTLYLLPSVDLSKGLITATTRPETMLGDSAMCVHPNDPRYTHIIGAEVKLPLTSRTIKVIADDRADPSYGTGVIKITPAHDFLDYDIGATHKLEIIQVVGPDGKMTSEAGATYAGLTIDDCRTKVVADLEAIGALLNVRPINHKVPISERGKDIIQPLISEQWFVKVDKEGNSLKQNALKLVRSGAIKVHPPQFAAQIEQWLENLHDWNISRQLWWGHRMPVWYRNGETVVSATPPPGSEDPKSGWVQETDTFDTWFSSGQWAYSTMLASGLATLGDKNSNFIPTHTMVMGRDILLFWACRMILFATYKTKQAPWKNIFFTGLIRDEKGQKMSKSKGNGIDPIETMNKYGTDALRLALIMGATAGNDINLGEKKIEGYSKFINKLWNAAKLIEMKVGESAPARPAKVTLQSSVWILKQTEEIITKTKQKLLSYDLSIACDELYSFVWMTYCDWYLEVMKVIIDKGSPEFAQEAKWVAVSTFRSILSLLHPFLPFVTEELFQKLPCLKDAEFLCIRRWSDSETYPTFGNKAETISETFATISAIRSVKAAIGVPVLKIRASAHFISDEESKLLVTEMGRVELCEASSIPPEKAIKKPIGKYLVVCEVDGKDQYKEKILKDVATQKATIETLEKKLSGQFATHAKPELVAAEREKLEAAKSTVAELSAELTGL
jgi:valyl-tRNA synthetase